MPKRSQKQDFFDLLDKAATTIVRKEDKKSSRSSGSSTAKKTHPSKPGDALKKQNGTSRAKTS